MGNAYLRDGTAMDYNDYIHSDDWQRIRHSRLLTDHGRCVLCHKDVKDGAFHTHHIEYVRLGHESLKDVITLCPECHDLFHKNWQRVGHWQNSNEGHWDTFNLYHTAQLCHMCWPRDYLICRDPNAENFCDVRVCKKYIEDYFNELDFNPHPAVDPYDIQLFVRNKRYELFFHAEDNGMSVEEFLDDYYGPKVRGKNPIRQKAGASSTFDHKPESFHRHYSENENINILMKEVAKLEKETK